jgi:hypothetical protein
MNLVLIDGCPVPASIAPYVKLVLDHAGQQAQSIYRGQDAAALLHAHGKHTQAEIHAMCDAGVGGRRARRPPDAAPGRL